MWSVKLADKDMNELFDWSADFMNAEWNEQAIMNKLLNMQDALICDALLDPKVFAGIGNIVRNEVLYNSGIHPLSKISGIKRYKLQQLIHETRNFASEFLKWKQHGILHMNWKVHQQECCPKHETPLNVRILGKTNKESYYCEKCQTLYI